MDMTARKRHWVMFGTSVTVAVCGGVWMTSNWDTVRRENGVSVHRETKSPEEIREYWTPERIRRSKPVEMPVWDPCEHFPSLLSPDCW